MDKNKESDSTNKRKRVIVRCRDGISEQFKID